MHTNVRIRIQFDSNNGSFSFSVTRFLRVDVGQHNAGVIKPADPDELRPITTTSVLSLPCEFCL